MHDLISETFVRQPEAPAICAWDGDLSYRELDWAASSVAHHLVSLGIGPEAMVGFCMSKSKLAPIAMIAVLRAGGILVPLGVEHPLSRIRTILSQNSAAVLLVDKEQEERLAGLVPHTVRVDRDLLASLPLRTDIACAKITPNNAAWVIYTSGSTGVPKGVVLDHAGISTALKAHEAVFEHFGPKTRRLQFVSFVFDVAIADILGSLMFGACLCIPSEHDRMNNVTGFMNRTRVSFAYFTATVAGLINPVEVPTLKTLVIGGEKVSPSLVERWLPYATIHIAYGPSECTVHSSLSKALSSKDEASTIGFPLTSRPWITNPEDYNQLVAIGDVGELLIEGVALSRGYLGDAEKTAAAFVFDPLFIRELGLKGAGRRMYRSGDLVRQNGRDGSLIFVSRADTQIKIRGQRVETGEIESAVVRLLPGVRMAVVDLIVCGDDSAQPALAVAIEFSSNSPHHSANRLQEPGFLPPTQLLQDDFGRLRTALLNVLPHYMVPGIYVPIEKLPMTVSGKLNRKAMQAILNAASIDQLSAYSHSNSPKEPPISRSESILRNVWADILRTEKTRIGRRDDIFHLGGDSVSAMMMVHKARSLGLNLTVADIFRYPTLSDMATVADANMSSSVQDGGTYRPFSLLNVHRRDVVIGAIAQQLNLPSKDSVVDVLPATDFQALCVAANLARPGMALQHSIISGSGPYSAEHLKQSCLRLIKQVDVLRSAFTFQEGKMFQVILESSNAVTTYETAEPLDNFTDYLVKENMFRPIKLGQPVADFAIITRQGTNEHRLLVRMSHAIYDGIALPFLWDTLKAAIEEQKSERRASFAEFMSDQCRRRTDQTYEYWRALLQGSCNPPIAFFPVPTKHALFTKALTRPMQIGLSAGLPSGTTSAMIVKAAWAMVLSSLTGSQDVIFAELTSGRSSAHPAVSVAIGCCANYIPVRVAFRTRWTTGNLLHHIREQQLESSLYETLGFRQIVQECTEWPSSRFTSVINFLHPASPKLQIGSTEYSISTMPRQDIRDVSEFSILCVQHPDKLQLLLAYASDFIHIERAELILEALCATVTALATIPDGLLSDHTVPVQMMSDHFAGLRTIDDVVNSHVLHAWQTVLAQKRGRCPGPRSIDIDFWEDGGDIVDAAYLVSLLQERGYTVTLDDLIAHPSLRMLSHLCQASSNSVN